MSDCKFCGKSIANKGSLKSHEMVCVENPDKIKHARSKNSGHQKGAPSPNKGRILDNSGKIEEKISSGEYRKYCETHIRRMVKIYLTKNFGHTCQICGISEWQGMPAPLVCDHVDGNSCNNDLANFRLVCANCDAQLPTFKSKNKGRGRAYDREYRQLSVEKLAELA
jgi:hypothetical protein